MHVLNNVSTCFVFLNRKSTKKDVHTSFTTQYNHDTIGMVIVIGICIFKCKMTKA